MVIRMKKREIILDFTSLLDIILIILFFFIMFSYTEANEVKNKAKNIEENAISLSSEAEKKLVEANKKMKQAEEELNVYGCKIMKKNALKEENNNSASHVEGLKAFGKSENINFFLEINNKDSFSIVICQGDTEINRITKLIPDKEQNRDYSFMQAIEEEIGKEIINTLESNKLVYDMTVISNFIYSSSVGGTNTVYKIAHTSFDKYVKRKYKNLYISFIDEGKIKND